MSKRLSNLVERDGVFHDLACRPNSSYRNMRRKEEMLEKTRMRQIWKDGDCHIPVKGFDDGLVINFDNYFGYHFSENTGHEEEIENLNKKITSLGETGFNLSSEKLEEACKTVRDFNEKLGIDNLKKTSNMGLRRTIGKDAIFTNDNATLYLLKDGIGFYTGDRDCIPVTRGVNMIPLKQDNKLYSKEFKGYLSKQDVKLGMHFRRDSKKFPNFYFRDYRKVKAGENDLLDEMIQRESSTIWDMEGNVSESKGYEYDNFRILETYDHLIYRDATNFHRVYHSGMNTDIYVEIPENYEYTLDPGEVGENVWGEVKAQLRGGDPSLISKYLFNIGTFRKNPSWEKFKSDKKFRKDITKSVFETSSTPSIETLFGNIRILSHSPNVKINNVDKVYGNAPENFKYEINCHSGGLAGKTEVIYDF